MSSKVLIERCTFDVGGSYTRGNDTSKDEFDGYLDDDLTTGSDESLSPTLPYPTEDAASTSSQADDYDAWSQPIPDFEQLVGCAEDVTGASPLQFFQQMVTDEILETIAEQTSMPNSTWKTPLFPHTPEHMNGTNPRLIRPS